MANKLFESLSNRASSAISNNPITQLIQFKKEFNGNGQDAQERIQQMLNDGRLSQEQYNRAVQKANWIASLLGRN